MSRQSLVWHQHEESEKKKGCCMQKFKQGMNIPYFCAEQKEEKRKNIGR